MTVLRICWPSLVLVLASLSHTQLLSADPSPSACPPTLAKIANLLDWNKPACPTKIVGPIYFVGTKGLGSWLIKSQTGLILINTGAKGSGPMIEASILSLGFDPKDIKILLACHAHVDHVGGHAYIQSRSGAKVLMLEQEADLLESGGENDFQYGKSQITRYPCVNVDQTFKEGPIPLTGIQGVTIQAIHTPGHSRGSTTFVMKVTDNGRTYTVVFPDGTGINPGYRLRRTFFRDPSYPSISADYQTTFEKLAKLQPDIWLAPHLNVFNFEAKRARVKDLGVAAWVDGEGYRHWLQCEQTIFDRKKPSNN